MTVAEAPVEGWKIEFIKPGERETVTITLAQFFDAIEANGLPQGFGFYWDSHDKIVRSGCALGQAALNLETDNSILDEALSKFKASNNRHLSSMIIHKNDIRHWSLKKIADYYRKVFASKLEETLTFEKSLVVVKES